MGDPNSNSTEEEIKKWISSISLICLSDEFQELKNELEQIYRHANVENPAIIAFQDALFAFIAQEEENRSAVMKAF
ncbi:MAG TPA: hypothetical protein DCK76_10060 [Desulfotomaculum sp.]|nr:MAG: hypothetical protein XD84_0543 [Desulfotomaculum sp. 46_80]HAG11698.1 hypothetical protein [Desulfotomaculum sp.]HBY05029.1 hypothetical protein [Desulfotomaculum sp.]